jgi:hypothetical protein
MITVSETIREIVSETPFLEEGLARGIINLSALARELQPSLKARLLKPVSESAILMAFKRYSARLDKRATLSGRIMRPLSDLAIRSNLTEFCYAHTPSLLQKLPSLLQAINRRSDRFLTYTQGIFEVNLIVNAQLERAVESCFKRERLISKLTNLSAVTLQLPKTVVQTPGVHYHILKKLAWANINVIEEVSTFSEFTIIFEKSQVDRAFSILNAMTVPDQSGKKRP